MNTDDRTQINIDTFIAPAPKAGEILLRPFSAGTLTLCRAFDLTMVIGADPEAVAALSADVKQRQLTTFLFIQSQPLEMVKKAVQVARADRQAFEDEYLLPFELEPSRDRDVHGDGADRASNHCHRGGADRSRRASEGQRQRTDSAPKLIEPVWTASFVFTLARETGWSEHFIFWELPLARLLQYQHCALRAHDVWTVPVSPPATHQLETRLTNWRPMNADA